MEALNTSPLRQRWPNRIRGDPRRILPWNCRTPARRRRAAINWMCWEDLGILCRAPNQRWSYEAYAQKPLISRESRDPVNAEIKWGFAIPHLHLRPLLC